MAVRGNETNKAILQRFTNEFLNTGNPAIAEELISADAVFHVPGMPPLAGPAGYLQIVAMMRSGFSDVQWKLEQIVAEGDTVAARFSMSGTHDGTFFGVPPTRKQMHGISLAFYRIANGRVIEEHGLPDMLSILIQIGAVPAPA